MNAKYIVALLILAVSFTQCKKGSITSTSNYSLDSKSSVEMKNLMVGKWKLHYTKRGYPYFDRLVLNNFYWDILISDSLIKTENGVNMPAVKVAYLNSATGTQGHWSLEEVYPSGGGLAYQLDSLRNDTLITSILGVGSHTFMTKQ